MTRRTIPVLVWSEAKTSHYHRPHGCMHEEDRVYTPSWAYGKEKNINGGQQRCNAQTVKAQG